MKTLTPHTSHVVNHSDSRNERIGIALAVLAALGFSMKAIFVKLAYASAPVDATTLLALRMGFAMPLFIWIGYKSLREGPALSRTDIGMLVVLGLLGYYGASILDFMGLQYISAGLERLILFTYPTLTILIGVLFMGKHLQRRQVMALALTYAGIGMAFAHDLDIASDIGAVLLGAGLVFGSSLSYALYSAGAETAVHRVGALRFSVLATCVSTVATWLHFALTQPVHTMWEQPPEVYGYSAAMGLFSTVLPVFCQSAAIRRIGSARSVLIGTLGPVLTIFLGWWLLSEPLSAWQMSGAALVVAGVLWVSRREKN